MRTLKDGCRPVYRASRERGSVYILVLGASLLIAAIGVSSLMAVRIQRRAASIAADKIQAREMARSGIDRVLLDIKLVPDTWRVDLKAGSFSTGTFANGTYAIAAVDPVDNNLTDSNADPVVLTSTGTAGAATYILEVTLNGDGTIDTGTWKRVVN
jgi:hypothetical protein